MVWEVMVVKPMESLWRCELCWPRWLSVHGTHKPRLRRLGPNFVAACQGSEPFNQAQDEKKGPANRHAKKSLIRSYSQIPSVAVEPGVGAYGAF